MALVFLHGFKLILPDVFKFLKYPLIRFSWFTEKVRKAFFYFYFLKFCLITLDIFHGQFQVVVCGKLETSSLVLLLITQGLAPID